MSGKGRLRAAGGPQGRAPALMSAADFLVRGGRGRTADPNLQLVAGRPARLPPMGAQEAAVWLRLLQLLTQAVRPSAALVASRPLLAMGPADLWRPALALLGPVGGRLPTATVVAQPRRLLLVAEPVSVAQRLQAYADARIRQVWLLDLDAGWTVAYRSPWAGAYHSRTLWYPGESVPFGFHGAQVEVLERGYQPPARGAR